VTLGQDNSVFDLQLKANFVSLLQGNIEIAGVKDLAKLFLNRAQHLILIKPRTDGLPDLRQQLVFFGSSLGIVHDHVIFQRQADLQRQTDEQSQIG
jgi:hypothetical protein